MSAIVLLRSGEMLDIFRPALSQIRIDDIAHVLARKGRWNDHTSVRYSVAEHSVRVADLLPPDRQLDGLMHDAAEAYLGDCLSPLKHLSPTYLAAEAVMNDVIAETFGVRKMAKGDPVHAADLRLLVTEARDLMPSWEWARKYAEPLPERIVPWTEEVARQRFLDRFYDLMRSRHAA